MVANAPSTRPVALEPDPDGIAARLRLLPHWGNWMFTPDARKRPVVTPVLTDRGSVAGGYWASKTKDEDWGPFEAAVDAYNRYLTSRNPYHGIYLLFTRDDGLLGIDIDHCVRPDGSIMPWALWIIEQIGSYVELSVSGTGIHIVVEAAAPWTNGQCYVTFPIADAEGSKVEIYHHTVGFAITGVRPALPDGMSVPAQVVAKQSGVDALYAWLVKQRGSGGPEDAHTAGVDAAAPAEQSPAMSDDQIILRARNAKNGTAFAALFDRGELTAYKGNHSRADQALCCMLAFWTQDAQQIGRLHGKSKLTRVKWNEVHYSTGETYGEHTVAKALELTTEHYSPPPEPEDEPASQTRPPATGTTADANAGRQWTEARDWDRRGPVTAEEARAMPRQQLEHYAMTWSRLQFDLYHLLTNQARVPDPVTGKERVVLNPTDKVAIACTWLDANRVPGVSYPDGHSHVLVRRDTIARQAGVSVSTVSRSLDHAATVGLITKDVVIAECDGQLHRDMYVGAPARMPRNTEPLPGVQEAEHRAADRERKTCEHCGGSVFVHRTVCGTCGHLLAETEDDRRDRLVP
jgi:putative DNA primase/helicase